MLWNPPPVCFFFKRAELKQRMTGGELTEDKDRRPGENVILASRAAQGPGLPDGALEGLAK